LPSTDSEQAGVSWQVAWWALVPLAISAMTQPCGSVLRRGSGSTRFFFRASPVICIADVFQFLLFILLGFSRDRRKWLRNIKYELKLRFEGEEGTLDLTNAENTIIMRWVLLGVGGIPCQTIKLVAMQGIPLTKTWALIFFISIIFGEVLILAARRLNVHQDDTIRRPLWRRTFLTGIIDDLAIIPISFQFVTGWSISISLALSIAQFQGISSGRAQFGGYSFGSTYSNTSLWQLIRLILPHTIVILLGFDGYLVLLGYLYIFGLILLLIMDFAMFSELLLFRIEGLFANYMRHLLSWPSFTTAKSVSIWIGSLVIIVCLSYLSIRLIPSFLKNLQVLTYYPINTRSGWQAFLVFVHTFLTSILCYSLAFQSEGTVNPMWIGVFG
jgi:hypothetical protein